MKLTTSRFLKRTLHVKRTVFCGFVDEAPNGPALQINDSSKIKKS
jgi:hypothetical protein